MPQFQDYTTNNNEDVEALGELGAIPGANLFSGAIAEGQAHDRQRAIDAVRGQNAQNIEAPEFQSYDGVNAQYAGNVDPSLYGTPEDAQVSLAADSAEGRSAQLAALQHMSQLTDQSAGSSMALGRQQANQDASQFAQAREGAIRQDAMRRGQLGGAADMISRQQAAQAGANQNLNAGLQNAQQAALMQLAGTQAGSSMAGQLRGQDQALAFNNADAINRFNMHNTDARNAANQANVQFQNTAKYGNQAAQQGFMNNRTTTDMNKIGANNTNKQNSFNNQMTKYNAIDDVLGGKNKETSQGAKDARETGKEGWNNLKDIAKMAGGGM